MAFRSSAGSNTDYEYFGTPDMIAADAQNAMNGLDDFDENEERSFFVRALYDFNSTESSSLSFKKGTLIEVLTQLESGWWDGLLGNDTRGWFPSNYVERISDAEAEAELQAQHDFADLTREDEQSDLMRGRLSHGTIMDDNADVENDLNNFKRQQEEEAAMHEALQRNPAKSVGAQYSGLGLGQDFNTLRRLMDGVASNDEDFDAFEQLAEATMTSNAAAAGRDIRDDRLGVIDARRRSRMSDQSSVLGSFLTSNGTSNSNHSQSDISSMITRSNAASLSDADNSRKVALMAAESASRGIQNALMDSLDKERIRAHTVSGPEGQQQDPQLAALLAGRPRAQTAHAGMPSTSSTNSSSGSQTILSRKGSKISGHETDSFWIPKVNEQGEIFYYNTQTGQQARDLPEGAESQEKEEYLEEKIASTSRYGSRTDSKLSRRAAPSSETSDSRPTSSSSLHTAATRHSRMNTIEKMPDPSQVPYPWIVRTSDDDRTFHFFNRQTNEISHDIDHILPSSPSAANEDNNTVRALNRRETVSRYGRSNSIAQGSSKRTADLLRYRNEDEADTTAFQSDMLMKDSLVELRQMIDETGDAIAVLASMASEEIGEDGLSVQDERALKEEQNSLKDESRLSVAIGNVVQKICDLLRAAGALNISPIDLMNASEVIQMVQDDQNAGEALASFQNSVHLLQGRTLSLNATYDSDPFVSSAIFASTPAAPPTLLPLGKKINATLSKLVLSARSVVEQSCLNAIERPSFTQPQLEKILSYRHRIKDDSMELARALGIFSNEVMHSKIVSRNGNNSQQKNIAYLKSGKANSGIGLNVFGGGSAAGWRGNGFVLPSATEAAVLRARTQMPEMQLSEMTKEAKEAFSTGSIALRRKPTQDLSRETVEEVIASRFAQYAEILSDLSSSLTTDEEGGHISAQIISVLTLKVLRRFGALISWIEELNLASFLDVDGPNAEDVGLTMEESEEYTKLVLNARQTLHTYGNVKQAAYDACQSWFLCVQDRTSDSMVLPDHRRIFHVDDEVLELVDLLGSSVVQLQSNLAELLHLSEEQAKYKFNSIGARAKVHGIDEIKMKMVEDKQEQSNRQIGGLSTQHTSSYSSSSTALAIPNGTSSTSSSTIAPGPSSTVSAIAPTSESKTASVPPSSLKAMFQRARSTSVATGNSAASNDSNRVPAHDDAEGTKGVSRLRRDTVDGVSSTGGAPSAPGSSIGDHGTDASSSKQAEEVPWFLQPDSPPEDIMLNPNGQVKGATLAALMERLTMHNAFDSSFNSTFLMTYRSFTTTDILLDLLFARFRIQEPPGLTLDEHEKWIEKKQRPIRFRVFNVLKSWLESHFHEDEDEEHMKRIRAFALDEMAHSPAMSMPANLLLRIIERRSGTGEQMKITMVMPASAPPPILPKNFRKIKFLDIDPLEMARQLTLMDSRLYNRIRPSECLGKAWSRDSGAWKAKGVRDVIGANNRVSGWVSEAILVQEDVKKRAAWVKHFVAIADRCFYLNNFSSMMAIYSGLNNASLNRLRRTWDAVNQRHLQLFENMRGILAPTRNFTRYRETLRKLNPPCVPFLGVYLTDLTFIEDGNTDRLRTDDRLINFSKRQMTAEKIQEIMIYQSTPYNLTPVPGLQKFIEENLIEARSDDELFEQSLRLEPREREDEKIARLLQESGFL